jgi:hypothetical protein
MHVVEESQGEVITLRYMERSMIYTTTGITVTASYSKEASSSYASLSRIVVNAMKTSPNLDAIPTHKTTVTGILISTAQPAAVNRVRELS